MSEDAPRFREGQQIELGTHRRQIRLLRVWVAVLAVLVMFGSFASGYQFFQQRTFSRHTRAALVDTQAALCTFRGDLQYRVDSSKAFLVTHPHGIRGLATREQIRNDIANRERTIRSLHGLSCPPRLPAPKLP